MNFLPLCFSNSLGIAPFVGQTCQKAPWFPSCRQCKHVFFCLGNNKHVIRNQSGLFIKSWILNQCESRCPPISWILCPGLRCINCLLGTSFATKIGENNILKLKQNCQDTEKKRFNLPKNYKCSFPNAPLTPFFNGFRGSGDQHQSDL